MGTPVLYPPTFQFFLATGASKLNPSPDVAQNEDMLLDPN
jgi:hypothetical protein